MSCSICGSDKSSVAFSHSIRNKYQANYMFCPDCGFLGVSNPHWLEEAYHAPINQSDTGCISRNLSLARKTYPILLSIFGSKHKFLDFAGGYGIFTRMMRDWGLDYYWQDRYSPNLFSQGFAFEHQNIEAVTTFESFEHFLEPTKEINHILNISRTVIFSTTLFDGQTPPSSDWEYYGFEHGQHISFYSMKTLKYLADKYDLHLLSNKKNLHVFTDKKISLFRFKLLLFLGYLPWDIFYRMFTRSKTLEDSRLLLKI